MASTKPKIAFYGLGSMGGGMATSLVKKSYDVTGYDTFNHLTEVFVKSGGKAASSAEDAARSADIYISMVANAAQNDSLLFDGPNPAVHSIKKSGTFILCSTCPPEYVVSLRQKLDQESNRPDIKLLDCPVSGGPIRAAAGTLSIFASGPAEDIESVAAILESMSANLYRTGDISAGSKTKTVHQLLAATNILAASEAMALAATVELNTRAVYEYVNKSDGASFMFENRVPHMLENDWHPYSALGIILKDAGIVTDTARKASFNTPLASVAEQEYLRGVQAGMLKDDDAKIVQLYLPKSQSTLVADKTEADVMMTASHQVSKDTIVNLLAGVHLAASIECMAFCKQLGIDRKIMAEVISKAAGWNAMFVKFIPAMLEKDEWSLNECAQAEDVRDKLVEAINRCRAMKVPCPLASAALQQFYSDDLSKR